MFQILSLECLKHIRYEYTLNDIRHGKMSRVKCRFDQSGKIAKGDTSTINAFS